MKSIFLIGWVSCLYESMSIWTIKWSCPGWIYVPRTPHPKGNEYHSICCSISGIIFGIEIVEGKNQPRQRCHPECIEKGKTASLLPRLWKPQFATGKVVILDRAFCVLEAPLTLKQYGVFASTLIKKERYWPKKAEQIKAYFQDQWKTVIGCLEIKFDLFLHKDPNYTMMLMSTYGACIERQNQ